MPLVSKNLPTLIGGVSQQAPTVRMESQCEVMENCMPSIVEFLRRRPATRHIAKIMETGVSDASIHVINRDAYEQYVAIVAGNDLKVFDLEGVEKPVEFKADKSYLFAPDPGADIGFLTINDYTFILNKTIPTRMSDEVTPTRTKEALVFIKQANYATDYTVTIDVSSFTHTTFKDDNRDTSGKQYTEKNGFNMDDTATLDANRYKLSSTVIAEDLAQKIREGSSNDIVCEVVRSVIWIRGANGQAFSIKVSDSRANSQISVATERVQKFSDLPECAPHGFITEVVGDQSSSFDNYFVVFKALDGNGFNTGVWVETVKPGITHKLDAATMPHALVRQADGSFLFKALEWTDRVCGDRDSAPDPSFIGRKIASVFFYRNRLGLLANENCVLSEAGKFFNFFPTTVTTIVDSDPIDVAASHTKAANLYHVAAFSEGLILFSDQTQFLLEHDDVLSSKTVAIKPITEFECSIKAAPISAGKNIYFATAHGQWGGVREYYVEENTSLTDATDITSHVPHYIEGDIRKLVVSTNEDCLLALSAGERNVIALYKYFWNGREKLQSSWSKWSFCGDVLSAAFLNATLLMVIQYPDGVYLEKLDVEPNHADPGEDFEYALDRKIDSDHLASVTYDPSLKRSTLTYPYQLTAKPAVVSGPGCISPPAGFDYEVLSWSGGTATVRGDLRGVAFLTGIPFMSRFVFSPQIMREDAGPNGGKLAVTEGRLQLRRFTLTHSQSGYFEVHVTPEYRETNITVFTARTKTHPTNILGKNILLDGTFTFPVMGNAAGAAIEINSGSFLPFRITSAGWEGYYHIRSRRV